MTRKVWRWIIRLALALSVACIGLWVLSLTQPFHTLPEFLLGGRRVALVSGFVYVKVSHPLSAAERNVVRQMEDLAIRVQRHEAPAVPMFSLHISGSSGDGWLVCGSVQEQTTEQVGPYRGVTNRLTGLWISPWAGVLAGILPWTLTRGVRFWQRRIAERRHAAGRCVRCGYDVRASGERCPECGMLIGDSGESLCDLRRSDAPAWAARDFWPSMGLGNCPDTHPKRSCVRSASR